MVEMYYKLVNAGLRKIQKVPDQFRDAVMADLEASALAENGKLLPTPIIPNVIVNNVPAALDL